MKSIQITGKSVRKFEDGYPLLSEKDLENPRDFQEGAWVQLENHGHFVAIAYFAKQRRGIGWILTLKANQVIDDKFFAEKFRAATAKRTAVIESSAYRLFNGEGDQLGGLVVDVYNGCFLFQFANRALARQAAMIYAGFKRVFGPDQPIVEAVQGAAPRVVSGHLPAQPMMIEEGTVRFPVDLLNGPTILPLELRDLRQTLVTTTAHQQLLTLFGNDNGVVVSALKSGAASAVSVDPAKRATTGLQAQLAANNLDQAALEIRTMDVPNYLDYALKHDRQFDTIVVTPPTFIRGQKHPFNLETDLPQLLATVLQLCHSGSRLFLVVTTPHYSMKRLRTVINETIKNYTGHVTVTGPKKAPVDFPANPADRQSDALKGFQLTID